MVIIFAISGKIILMFISIFIIIIFLFGGRFASFFSYNFYIFLEHCGTFFLLLLFSDQTETNFNSLCFGGTQKNNN